MINIRRAPPLWFGVTLGAVVCWMLAVSTSPRLGVTFDEPGHIFSGHAHWREGDYRINAENGVLGGYLVAWALASLKPASPPQDTAAWRQPNTRALGDSFFFGMGNDPQALLKRARMATAAFGALLVVLVACWARRLFGTAAGWLALAVTVFSPTLLAHSGLATSDIVVTACFLAAVTAFWRLWHRVTWFRLAIATLATAATLLAKMSGLLLFPMLGLLLLMRVIHPAALIVRLNRYSLSVRSRLGRAWVLLLTTMIVGLGSVQAIWAAYDFRFSAAPRNSPPELGFDPSFETLLHGGRAVPTVTSSLIEDPYATPARPVVVWVISQLRRYRLLPEGYLWGVTFTLQSARSRPTFFFGRTTNQGSRAFFPAAFVLKSTPTELLLLVLGVAALLAAALYPSCWPAGRAPSRRWLYRSSPLLVMGAVYGTAAVASSLNIGHRHLLPFYPLVYVFAAAAACWISSRARVVALTLLGLAATAQVASALHSRPYYLSYFTPLASRQPWEYLVDSSLDWGQGLPDLERWIEEKKSAGDHTPVVLSYFGSDSPGYRGLHVTRFGDWRDSGGMRHYPAPVKGGWYAISATHFQRVYLGIGGPWSQYYEQRYQETLSKLPKSLAMAAQLSEAERALWLRSAMLCEVFQFGRICHYLRDESPTAVVGASLLLYRLSDEEVAIATAAPLEQVERARETRRALRR